MAVSARLRREVDAKVTRFCRSRGIRKTEAIERGIGLLMEQDREHAHPGYVAYQQLKLVPEEPAGKRSSDSMRVAIRAKYPD